MKNKLKAILPLLFVIALLAVIPFSVNADVCAHEWSEWEIISEGGCDEYGFWWGRTQRSCLLCGESETEFIDPPHDLVFIEVSEPQCDKPGAMIDHYRCNICGMLWSDISLEVLLDEEEIYIYKHSKENLTYLTQKNPPAQRKDGSLTIIVPTVDTGK